MMFTTLPLSSIIVERESRQRRTIENIEEMMDSLQRIGLINPIVITQDNVLIAGERRLTAARELGWTHIPVQYKENLDEFELAAIELEENIKRDELSWQDTCDAVLKYHNARVAQDPEWSQRSTAESLGISTSAISNYLIVANAVVAGVPRVAEAPRYSVALNVAQRVASRAATEHTAVIQSVMDTPKPAREVPLLHADFHEFTYTGTPFNLLHCDFPYGINAQAHGMGMGMELGKYDDGEDVYWSLLDRLATFTAEHVAESAHMIFWFSMTHYQRTFDRLTAMGWSVLEHPLIWFKSDNAGAIPDPNRTPRRIYETAFLCSRGDRKLTANGAVGNCYPHPGKDKSLHMSEKPVPMLTHFMRMLVDEYTIMLDPTAGSANALKAASALGAASVLGLERDAEFFERSVAEYHRSAEL